jgi:hypothetical protein
MKDEEEKWGNIELPGLSDEKLHSTNWNRITGAREAVKSREANGWKEKNEQRYQDPKYKEFWIASIKEAYKNPELREIQRQKGLSIVHTEETKEKIRQANLGKQRKGEPWIEGMKQKRKGQATTFKPIVTPVGVFMRMQDAVEPTGISIGRLRKYIRTFPWSKDYYHISREEYTRLTGREI